MRRSAQALGALGMVLCWFVLPKVPASVGVAAPQHKMAGQRQNGMLQAYQQLPLGFELNRGQTNHAVRFLARGFGSSVYLGSSGMTLAVSRSRTEQVLTHLSLVGARTDPDVVGTNKLPGIVNYLIGEHSSSWLTNIPIYARVQYRNAYPGITMVFYGKQSHLEYDFVLKPGADPNLIHLRLSGAGSLRLDKRGNLIGSMGGFVIRQELPKIYQMQGQKRRSVSGHYVLSGKGVIGFSIGRYVRSQPLIIDPTISYATYLGGSSNDYGTSVAVDSSGNAYLAGQTTSSPPSFPILSAFKSNCNVNATTHLCPQQGFVSKFNATGTALLYSTYYGSYVTTGPTFIAGIAVDSAGEAVITGNTQSAGIPRNHAAQSTYGGLRDAFVAELSAAGNSLIYGTYLGGSAADYGTAVALDASGNAYVTGYTASTNFPTCPGASTACASSTGAPLQSANKGTTDIFVTKLTFNTATSVLTLAYSTYLGGSSYEQAYGIAVDTADSAYVTGFTDSTDFPTKFPIQASNRSNSGYADVIISRLSPAGNALVYSTYLGGKLDDFGYALAIDPARNVYVTGSAASTDFPVKNALSATKPGLDDGFVSKLAFNGTTHVLSIVYSTYLGGSSYDYGFGIAADASGNGYVTGLTDSTNFPRLNAFQPAPAGGDEAYVIVLGPTGALSYGTYYGGSGDDRGNGIVVDGSGNFYVAGQTTSTNFPTTSPEQASNAGLTDAFLLKGHA